MRRALSILFGAGFTVATAWALGRILFDRLQIRLRRLEHEVLAGIVGSALLSLLVFGLCALGLVWTASFWVVGGVALYFNYRVKVAGRVEWPGAWWFAVFGVYAFVYLVNAVAPEYSPDGQTYHLGLVYRFFREHGFHRITTSFYANMPLGMEMLFLDAFSLGRQSAAATVECCFLLALPLLIFSYGQRIGHSAAGAGAALLVFLSPVAGFAGSTAYNDIALTTASFGAFYLAEIWREDPDAEASRWLPVAMGLAAGFCFAIKYTGFPAMLYVMALLLWQRRPKALAWACLAAALIAVPWLVKNWIYVGNPLAPFLNRLFPNPYIHVNFEDFTRTWYRRYDVEDLRPWFWMVTVTGRLGGQLGPWFLLAPIGLAALKWREGRRVLLAGAVFLIPYPQNIAARFLLPVLPFVALAMALVLIRWRLAMAGLVACAALLAWPSMTARYETGGNVRIRDIPWKAALRLIPQDEFLAQHSFPWITGQMLDTYVPAGKKVLSTTPVGEGYSKTDVMVTYQSAEGDQLQDTLTIPTQGGLLPTWNLRYTFPARVVGRLRMTQTASHPVDIWSIGELKFFSGDREVKALHLDSRPFPYDIGLAVDGNLATRWMAWEPIRPGMFVEAEFAQGTTLDRVELHSSHDQGKVVVQLDGIDARLEKVDGPAPGDLRLDATRELRRHGIDYLLIDDGNWVAADIRENPELWGMKFVTERGGNRLYVLY